jgi:hypothetical protein
MTPSERRYTPGVTFPCPRCQARLPLDSECCEVCRWRCVPTRARPEPGPSLRRLLLAGCILACLAGVGITVWEKARRSSQERQFNVELKQIATAQADVRANDRDQNGVHDYWTADIRGLYTVCGRLIESGIAVADLDPSPHSRSLDSSPQPFVGCWYLALLGGLDAAPEQESFGAAAICGFDPRVWIVREDFVLFKRRYSTELLTADLPPKLSGAFHGKWPHPSELASCWSKLD